MSDTARPKVWVSQPLFDDVVEQLGAHFELVTTAQVTAYSSADLAALAMASTCFSFFSIKS